MREYRKIREVQQVCFSFSMTGQVTLFHLLQSRSDEQKKEDKCGQTNRDENHGTQHSIPSYCKGNNRTV